MGETNFEREVLDRLTRIEVKTDGYDELKKVVYQNRDDVKQANNNIDDIKREVNEMKEKNKWLVRTIVGAVIASVVGIVFCFIKIGMGV